MKIPKIFYGWWIAIASSAICMVGYGFWLYTFSVFFKPMSLEFGWTRAMTAGAYSLRTIEGGIASPVVGWAVDKYGSRIVIIIGAIISGLGFAGMYFIQTIIGFYLFYGIILSIGMSAMTYLPAWTVVAKWFSKRLSWAMALVTSGAAVGGFIAAPLSAKLIAVYGWRISFVIIAVIIWVVVIPLALVVRENPAEMGLAMDGAPLAPKPEISHEGNEPVTKNDLSAGPEYTLKEALLSAPFWFLSLSFFFQGMSHSTVTVHLVPALTDAGIDPGKAAWAIGYLTLISLIGRLLFGYLGDIITKRYLFMVSYGMMGAGMLVLTKADNLAMVFLFTFLFGVGFGGGVPLMPAIRAEYFGRKALGKIQGFMNPVMMAAGAVGPIFAGYIFDTTQSYKISFVVTAILTFCAAGAMFFARPSKVKESEA